MEEEFEQQPPAHASATTYPNPNPHPKPYPHPSSLNALLQYIDEAVIELKKWYSGPEDCDLCKRMGCTPPTASRSSFTLFEPWRDPSWRDPSSQGPPSPGYSSSESSWQEPSPQEPPWPEPSPKLSASGPSSRPAHASEPSPPEPSLLEPAHASETTTPSASRPPSLYSFPPAPTPPRRSSSPAPSYRQSTIRTYHPHHDIRACIAGDPLVMSQRPIPLPPAVRADIEKHIPTPILRTPIDGGGKVVALRRWYGFLAHKEKPMWWRRWGKIVNLRDKYVIRLWKPDTGGPEDDVGQALPWDANLEGWREWGVGLAVEKVARGGAAGSPGPVWDMGLYRRVGRGPQRDVEGDRPGEQGKGAPNDAERDRAGPLETEVIHELFDMGDGHVIAVDWACVNLAQPGAVATVMLVHEEKDESEESEDNESEDGNGDEDEDADEDEDEVQDSKPGVFDKMVDAFLRAVCCHTGRGDE